LLNCSGVYFMFRVVGSLAKIQTNQHEKQRARKIICGLSAYRTCCNIACHPTQARSRSTSM